MVMHAEERVELLVVEAVLEIAVQAALLLVGLVPLDVAVLLLEVQNGCVLTVAGLVLAVEANVKAVAELLVLIIVVLLALRFVLLLLNN